MKPDVRKANPIDAEVGGRIRMFRKLQAMSQTRLAAVLGVTAQQMQKYEAGLSRVAAGRLQIIATELGVPVTALFAPAEPNPWCTAGGSGPVEIIGLRNTDTIEFNQAFSLIADRDTRRALLALVVALSQVDDL